MKLQRGARGVDLRLFHIFSVPSPKIKTPSQIRKWKSRNTAERVLRYIFFGSQKPNSADSW